MNLFSFRSSLIMLGVLAAAWIFHLSFVRKSDIEIYMQTGKKQEIATTKPITQANQKREGVRKDIWFTQEDKSRLHTRIDSQASTLTLLPKDDKVDIIENLEQIKCWMQEKLYVTGQTPMQTMRYFEADQGTYQYATQRFFAQSVVLSLFRTPGHDLPMKFDPSAAFLRGIAQDVSFSVSGKTTQFKAQQFKATLRSQNEDVR